SMNAPVTARTETADRSTPSPRQRCAAPAGTRRARRCPVSTAPRWTRATRSTPGRSRRGSGADLGGGTRGLVRRPPTPRRRSGRPQASAWRTVISQAGTMRGMTPSSPTTEDPRGTAPSAARTSEARSARIAVTVFPALILAAAAFGFFVPAVGQSLAQSTSIYRGIIMVATGLALTVPDFALVARRPLPILIGVVAQYVIMPLVGLGIAMLLQRPAELAVGVILVGSAPGGTSSNVISYLSKADTALSVTMSSTSALLAPLFTPLLTLWLAGSYLPVDAGAMAMSIVKMVLIPVIGGLVIRLVAGRLVARILPALPWVSVAGISLVVIAVVSGSTEAIVSAGAIVLLAVVLHNG